MFYSNSNCKVSLLYKLFNSAGIPDEIITKILYEFKGLGNNININKSLLSPYFNTTRIGKYIGGNKTDCLDNIRTIERHLKVNFENYDLWWIKRTNGKAFSNSFLTRLVKDDYDFKDYLDKYEIIPTAGLLYTKELQVRLRVWMNWDIDTYWDRSKKPSINYNRIFVLLEKLGLNLEKFNFEELDDPTDKREQLLFLYRTYKTHWEGESEEKFCVYCRNNFPTFFCRKISAEYDDNYSDSPLQYFNDGRDRTWNCLYCKTLFDIEREDERRHEWMMYYDKCNIFC